MEHLNPRATRWVALEKPSEIAREHWYFQRYMLHSMPYTGKDVRRIGESDDLIVGVAPTSSTSVASTI